MGKVLYAYFLAVALGWAAFPIIVIALSQYAQLYVVLSVYTFVVTLVFICILYMMMHGFGELDRKPYQWARYNMKGFACAAAAFALIVLAEIIMILLADKYIIAVSYTHLDVYKRQRPHRLRRKRRQRKRQQRGAHRLRQRRRR